MPAANPAGEQKHWILGTPYRFLSSNALGGQNYWFAGTPYVGLYVAGGADPNLTLTIGETLSFSETWIFDNFLILEIGELIELVDEWIVFLAIPIELEETLSLTDAWNVDFLIFVGGILLELGETLELDEESFFIDFRGDAAQVFELSEKLYFQDSLDISEPKTPLDPSETLDLSESIEFQMAGAIEAFDTLQYFWADEVIMELGQTLTVGETLVLSESIEIQLIIVGINVTVAETLVLADTWDISAFGQRQFAENFIISESIKMELSHLLEIGELLVLSESVANQLDFTGGVDVSETLALSESIEIVLTTPLTLNISEALSLSDQVSAIRRGTISSYLRRYLNDVPR